MTRRILTFVGAVLATYVVAAVLASNSVISNVIAMGLPVELVVDVCDVRRDYEALGGAVRDPPRATRAGAGRVDHGPIPRVHPERNWTPLGRVERDGALVEDDIPEDQALVVDTVEGLVVLAGCGHAGIVNTLEYAR